MTLRSLALSLVGCLIAGVNPAGAEAPAANASMVLDLRRTDPFEVSPGAPYEIEAAGRMAFTISSPGGSSPRVWASDGTVVGTRVVAEPCGSENCGGLGVASLGVVGTHFFFVVEAAAGGQVWMADGTEGGTRVVGTIDLDTGSSQPRPGTWARSGNRMLLVEHPPGTPGLSRLVSWQGGVRSIVLETEGWLSLFDLGDRVLVEGWQAQADPAYSRWETDGTAGGTTSLGTAILGLDTAGVAVDGRWIGRVYLDGWEVLSTQGAGTTDKVLTSYHVPEPFSVFFPGLVHRGGHAYWIAYDTLTGWELWRTDGSTGGTVRLSDFPYAEALAGTRPRQIGEHEGAAIFVADDGITGCSVWRVQVPSAPVKIDGLCPASLDRVGTGLWWQELFPIARVRGLVAGVATPGDLVGCSPQCGLDLSRSETVGGRTWIPSSQRGLVEVADLAVVGASPVRPSGFGWFARAANQRFALLFRQGAPGQVGTVELALLDQEFRQMAALANLGRTAESSRPVDLVTGADEVWFSLCPAGSQFEVGVSDGTTNGTEVGFSPGASGCFSPVIVPVGPGRAISAGDDGLVGLQRGGTSELLVAGAVYSMVATADQRALAAVDTSAAGSPRLYRTDGTAAGTVLLPFPTNGFFSMLPVGTGVLISYSGASSPGLYWLDPSTGTHSLVGPPNLELVAAVEHLGKPYLLARRFGSEGVVFRVEQAGAVEVGTVASLHGASRVQGFSLGQRLVFLANQTFSLTLVMVDEGGVTAAGFAFPGWDSIRGDTSVGAKVGDQVVFPGASTGHGLELWASDGTVPGTRLIADLVQGPDSSIPTDFASLGDVVAFSANDRIHGREMWVTDGSPAGTRLLQDLAPGPVGSNPTQLVATADRLFFSANDQSWGRELWSLPLATSGCDGGEFGMCLGDLFRAEIQWRDFSGGIGRGTPVPLTEDSGAFWFFDPANLESIVKVLDGRVLNGHWWTFFGSLTNVDFALTVTDVTTGAARRWINPSGNFASAGDTEAFGPRGASSAQTVAPKIANSLLSAPPTASRTSSTVAPCVESSTRLCLNDNRFAVEATWSDFSGNSGVATVRPITEDTGAFWFFDAENLEVLVKVLDGRPLNGAFWVFYGAISNVEYDLVVTDSLTGERRTYHNPSGAFASRGDTSAFPQ